MPGNSFDTLIREIEAEAVSIKTRQNRLRKRYTTREQKRAYVETARTYKNIDIHLDRQSLIAVSGFDPVAIKWIRAAPSLEPEDEAFLFVKTLQVQAGLLHLRAARNAEEKAIADGKDPVTAVFNTWLAGRIFALLHVLLAILSDPHLPDDVRQRGTALVSGLMAVLRDVRVSRLCRALYSEIGTTDEAALHARLRVELPGAILAALASNNNTFDAISGIDRFVIGPGRSEKECEYPVSPETGEPGIPDRHASNPIEEWERQQDQDAGFGALAGKLEQCSGNSRVQALIAEAIRVSEGDVIDANGDIDAQQISDIIFNLSGKVISAGQVSVQFLRLKDKVRNAPPENSP